MRNGSNQRGKCEMVLIKGVSAKWFYLLLYSIALRTLSLLPPHFTANSYILWRQYYSLGQTFWRVSAVSSTTNLNGIIYQFPIISVCTGNVQIKSMWMEMSIRKKKQFKKNGCPENKIFKF